MAYGFYAFIDEAGDEGFKFRDPPERGSSQWFVLSAAIVRESNRTGEMRDLKDFIENKLNFPNWTKLHFRGLTHEKRLALTDYLRHRPIRAVTVAWNKRHISEDGKPHSLNEQSRLHHYAIRYLIERISWLCDNERDKTNPLPCRLVFSKCKNLRYDAVKAYLEHLSATKTSVRWKAIDRDNFMVRQSSELIGLKIADVVASGIFRGLELGEYGLTEQSYARHLRDITYHYQRRFLIYGLKVMPVIPAVEPERDNRYSWIATYQ